MKNKNLPQVWRLVNSRLPCWSMGYVVITKKRINNSGNSKDKGGGWSIDVDLNGLKAKRNMVRDLKKGESREEIPGEGAIYINKQEEKGQNSDQDWQSIRLVQNHTLISRRGQRKLYL